MNDIHDQATPPRDPNRKMTREEVVKAVTEKKYEKSGKKRFLVIPSLNSDALDLDEILKDQNLGQGSKKYGILKLFCETKTPSLIDIKALIQRIEHLTPEQLDILEKICGRREFAAKTILEAVQSIKRVGREKLLALRAFVDLEGLAPGPLNRFFSAVLPREEIQDQGPEAAQLELQEKTMRPDQVNAFYLFCTEVPDITHGNAISLLIKARSMGRQHTQFVSKFLKAGTSFGDRHITNNNIVGLVNLLLSLPEFKDQAKFKKMVKKLSRKAEDKKKDFHYLLQAYREEAENEQRLSSGIRGLFLG